MFTSHRAAVATTIALLLAAASGCSKSAGAGSSGSPESSSNSKIAENLTDLPTYPNLISGSMMGHPPTQGGLYNARTNDSYATVVAWYRSHLSGATESHSGYIDSTTGHKEIEFRLAKWGEEVVIEWDPNNPDLPNTGISLGQDAHH